MSGLTARAEIALPAISPPPPIGITSTSMSGASSSISSAMVPWPAITCGSSYGCTQTSLRSRGDLLGAHLRVRHGLAVQHHGGAVRFGRGDLHERRRHRHHDGRRNVQPPGVIGDRLRVIAGRHRDDAARAFGFAQRGELHERAALLERVGDLQVLVFDPHLRAGELRQLRRGQHRRAQHLGPRWCAARPRCRTVWSRLLSVCCSGRTRSRYLQRLAPR